jgi:hypothetical protein
MLDNGFSTENIVSLRAASLAEPGKDGTAAHNPGASQMRDPRPFVVIQNGTFLFVIHAYSARQARTLVPARLAGLADRHSLLPCARLPRNGAAQTLMRKPEQKG